MNLPILKQERVFVVVPCQQLDGGLFVVALPAEIKVEDHVGLLLCRKRGFQRQQGDRILQKAQSVLLCKKGIEGLHLLTGKGQKL